MLFFVLLIPSIAFTEDQLPVAAPMTTELAGKSANLALESVIRIICPSKNITGTGFLHKSGKIITVAHVVKDCKAEEIFVCNVQGKVIRVSDVITDVDLDLALLTTKEKLKSSPLSICQTDTPAVGTQVTTWGFPTGYAGFSALLSTGYIAGSTEEKINNKTVGKLIVNAAFNSGNSGGPLVEIENGTVIGVVCSKLAPLPDYINTYLNALENANFGFMRDRTFPDGTKDQISESQIVAEILQYLRSQTQLVIGSAVLLNDLRTFLKSNGIEP